MNQDLVVQFMGSVVLATIVGALLNGLINRRKLSAEATEIITRAASGVVERLEDDIERGERREQALMLRVADLEAGEIENRRVLQEHAAWDHMAVAALQAAGILDLPDPPPLLPPPHTRVGRVDRRREDSGNFRGRDRRHKQE